MELERAMIMPSSDCFPKLLKAHRIDRGWTQQRLAGELGVSIHTLSAWEQGRRKPNHLDISRLATNLKMDISELTNCIEATNTKEKCGQEALFGELIKEFQNQDSCESHIRKCSRHAQKIRVLTIRGEIYFVGGKSLLHTLLTSGEGDNCTIEVLVLSPESDHITEELAKKLQKASIEIIREKMRINLNNLKFLAHTHANFQLKCYLEKPNFKILLFDDVMFVTSFACEEPKNDSSVKMFMMNRKENPLFAGFERLFDELWKHSSPC